MAHSFDQSETTLVWNYPEREVELYTTDRRLWLRCIRRNPRFLRAKDLKPGYVLVYSMDLARRPEMIFTHAAGGEERELEFLTPEELENRRKRSERARSAGTFQRKREGFTD